MAARNLTSARERFQFFNGLTCLVKALEGKRTTIDLRNDSFITGEIENVDGFMNVVINDAIYTDTRGNCYKFESFFIQARNIRYVHIPESMPIVQTIELQLQKFRPQGNNDGNVNTRKKTFKGKRAMTQHLQTVASMGESSQQN